MNATPSSFATPEEAEAAFLFLWRRVAAASGRELPRWRDFTPADLVPFSEFLVVFDWTDRQKVRFRYRGTGIDRISGSDGRGGQGFIPDEGDFSARLHRACLAAPCGYKVVRQAAETGDKLVSVGLPATDGDGASHFLLSHSWLAPDSGFFSGQHVIYRIASVDVIDIGFGGASLTLDLDRSLDMDRHPRRFLTE